MISGNYETKLVAEAMRTKNGKYKKLFFKEKLKKLNLIW